MGENCGFREIKAEKIEDIRGEGRIYLHGMSGAELFFLKTQDPNRVFHITFATPPVDDCGTPHILEHSVLCGSKNYPARESFIELAKSSLKTFINAFTFPDKTMYPVASMNFRDLTNLVTVYMDAVFQPNLLEKEDIFLQEGWHYEIDEEKNLTYQGVVYNEMRGVYSSPDALLRRKIQDLLFPDTCYGRESGGDPDHIPQLTYDGFKEFYKAHYFPKNSKLFLYGKFTEEELQELLTILDKKLIEAETDSKERSAAVFSAQKPFQERKSFRFPVPAEEESGEKGYYGFGWCIQESLNSELAFSMDVLTHILAGTPSSPLKRELVEKGIGRDVSFSHDAGIYQPTLALTVKGGKKGRLEEVAAAITNCLENIVKNGINGDLLEASMNFVEFQFREADFGGYPKGLIYGLQVMETWLYGGDPTERLRFENRIKNIREAMKDGYFEALIEKYILRNPHSVGIELYEEAGLGLKNVELLKEKLLREKQQMGETEFSLIEAQTDRLKAIQKSGDNEKDLKKLPLLKLEEIRKDGEEKPKTWLGKDYIRTEQDTAGIAYAVSFYNGDLEALGAHPGYGRIATEMLGSVDAGGEDFGLIQQQILKETGGLDFNCGVFAMEDEDRSFLPYMNIKTRCLDIKREETNQLVKKIFQGTEPKVNERFHQIIGELFTRIEAAMTQESHSFVINKLASRIFPWGAYIDKQRGMAFYELLKKIQAKEISEEDLVNSIKGGLSIYQKAPLLTSVAGGFGEEKPIWAHGDNTLINRHKRSLDFAPTVLKEAYTTNGKVNYCGLGFDYKTLGLQYSGDMKVLGSILRYGYLWNEVRVKGGAYGAFFGMERSGYMYMASYRDPRIEETLLDFGRAANYIDSFAPTEEEMRKYIIGTISGVDAPRSNASECDRTAELSLKGITEEMLQKEREEILSVTPEQIRRYGDVLREMGQKGNVVVIGQKEAIESKKTLFDTIAPLMTR